MNDGLVQHYLIVFGAIVLVAIAGLIIAYTYKPNKEHK